jgi:hypothetical protein
MTGSARRRSVAAAPRRLAPGGRFPPGQARPTGVRAAAVEEGQR